MENYGMEKGKKKVKKLNLKYQMEKLKNIVLIVIN